MHYIWMFCIFTALAIAVRGMSAVQWPLGLLQSVRSNLALALANKLIFAPILFFAVDQGYSALQSVGLSGVPRSTWDGVPIWIVALLYVVGHDFMDYWNHRLLHTPSFWPIHAVHHSDPDMNWTTTYRVHILESVLMKLSYIGLALATGLPPIGVLAGFLLFTVYNAFVHLDADIHFGPLTKVFATPRFHRWHHADTPEAYNKNFANIFAFWDVVFGTYRVPGPCQQPLGFAGTPGHRFDQLLIWPFLEWGRAARRALGQREQTANKILTP